MSYTSITESDLNQIQTITEKPTSFSTQDGHIVASQNAIVATKDVVTTLVDNSTDHETRLMTVEGLLNGDDSALDSVKELADKAKELQVKITDNKTAIDSILDQDLVQSINNNSGDIETVDGKVDAMQSQVNNLDTSITHTALSNNYVIDHSSMSSWKYISNDLDDLTIKLINFGATSTNIEFISPNGILNFVDNLNNPITIYLKFPSGVVEYLGTTGKKNKFIINYDHNLDKFIIK